VLLLFSQTEKINQGNTALKRVVESIANGDSHVPFRDIKLTMLLQVHYYKKVHLLIQPLLPNDDLNISFIAFQDSFEDDKSKILMILCASPDPKELHKTISTLEYGAKAKCIVRAAHAATPRDKMSSEESFVEENWLKVTS
jgi:kinesin family member 11